MKVRVPKEHRPPDRFRFEIHGQPERREGLAKIGTFTVKGVYRPPQAMEFYWSPIGWEGHVFRAGSENETSGRSRVILERVK